MSELARRRKARDLWISRGHLGAAAAMTAALAVASFALGFLLGEHRRPEPTHTDAFVPDGSLVELLARIEATAAPHGAIDALTFPDALRGPGATPELPPASPPREGRVDLAGPSAAPGDRPLPGRFTVVVGQGNDEAKIRTEAARLRRQGLGTWVGAAVIGGRLTFRIAVGGFDTEEAAREGLRLAEALGVSGTVEPIAWGAPEGP